MWYSRLPESPNDALSLTPVELYVPLAPILSRLCAPKSSHDYIENNWVHWFLLKHRPLEKQCSKRSHGPELHQALDPLYHS